MRSQWLLSLTVWLVFSLVAVLPAGAVSRLDGSFGLNGRVAVELGVRNSAHAVLVQPDGSYAQGGDRRHGANARRVRGGIQEERAGLTAIRDSGLVVRKRAAES